MDRYRRTTVRSEAAERDIAGVWNAERLLETGKSQLENYARHLAMKLAYQMPHRQDRESPEAELVKTATLPDPPPETGLPKNDGDDVVRRTTLRTPSGLPISKPDASSPPALRMTTMETIVEKLLIRRIRNSK